MLRAESYVEDSPVVTDKEYKLLEKQIQQLTEKVNNLKKQVDTMS